MGKERKKERKKERTWGKHRRDNSYERSDREETDDSEVEEEEERNGEIKKHRVLRNGYTTHNNNHSKTH
ncbi:hypothetical protein Baya_6695 [Bagarius yarrelli]|uniref:Uncharacterized protein n=1 Tax=Bagarius yarrelli TaxID=175774 RepID=A0A556U1K8_BAGYA|nr:hypothetical protein Baya_6695 [Bagarius yarrelli]